MKGWCVTCQLRTGLVTPVDVLGFADPCPYAKPADPPHLVHVVLPFMYTPSRSVTILDLSAI